MQINQMGLFGEEKMISKVTNPSKITKEMTRPFKCVLCGKMVAKLEGTMCTNCYCEKLAKDRKARTD